MSSFHLRPVSEPSSSSPSPTSPSSSRTLLKPSSPPTMSRVRRPLSPTSLRGTHHCYNPLSPPVLTFADVDLTHDGDLPPRKYPAPPTGHDLMALFPPAPPEVFPEMVPGPTSGFFRRQERAFFAQAGKEIVRVRVEVDLPHELDIDSTSGKSRARDPSTSRPWSNPGHAQQPLHPQHTSPPQSSAHPPVPFPHPSSRPPRGPTVPVAPSTHYPGPTHPQQPQPSQVAPPNLHPVHQQQQHPAIGLRTPPQDNTKPEFQQEEDPDEAWRRPMPYAERRRAGKHTRRVIVRN